MPNISCYYKCGLSALPGKLCHRFYIFSREIAHWLQFGVITIVLRAFIAILKKMTLACTVVPVMNGHPRDQAKVSVHCRWPLIRGNLTLKCVGRGIDNVAVQGRWPLTTGVAQGRYYCI